jgi:hypothetical protein
MSLSDKIFKRSNVLVDYDGNYCLVTTPPSKLRFERFYYLNQFGEEKECHYPECNEYYKLKGKFEDLRDLFNEKAIKRFEENW